MQHDLGGAVVVQIGRRRRDLEIRASADRPPRSLMAKGIREGMHRPLIGPDHDVEEGIRIQIGPHRRAAQEVDPGDSDPLRESGNRRSRGTPRVDRGIVVGCGHDIGPPIAIDVAHGRRPEDRPPTDSLRPVFEAAPAGLPAWGASVNPWPLL